jgi:peptidoglycan/LPS O-acetylase OafA/YrhL
LPGRALSKVAARIGFYSYSIYLWHEFVGLALIHSGVSFWRFWSYIAACIIGGVSMAYLVEMPYLALRERFFPPSQNTSDLSASSSERVALSPVNASPV